MGGGTAKNLPPDPAQDAADLLAILCNYQDAGHISAGDFAEAMETDKAKAERTLTQLVKQGRAEIYRRGRGTYYRPAAEG